MYNNLYLLTLICMGLGILISLMAVTAIVTNRKLGKQLALAEGELRNSNEDYSLNYKKDIIFLEEILSELIENTIITLELSQITFINNSDFKQLVAETAFNIDKRMSPQYRKRMERYFSEEGFNDYINDKVIIAWTKVTMNVMGDALGGKKIRKSDK